MNNLFYEIHKANQPRGIAFLFILFFFFFLKYLNKVKAKSFLSRESYR